MADEMVQNYLEAMEKFDQYSFEYERRFLTSLSVISGAALAFCLTFSQSTEDSQSFLYEIRISLWCFLIALIFSGLSIFLNAKKFSSLSSYYNQMRFARLRKVTSKDEKSPQVNMMLSADLLNRTAHLNFVRFRKWNWAYWLSVGVCGINIVTGIAWPIFLITNRGYIS